QARDELLPLAKFTVARSCSDASSFDKDRSRTIAPPGAATRAKIDGHQVEIAHRLVAGDIGPAGNRKATPAAKQDQRRTLVVPGVGQSALHQHPLSRRRNRSLGG